MKFVLLAAVAAAAYLALPAAATTPVFVVGASAIVTPKAPSFLPEPWKFRAVTRPTAGVYCLTTSRNWRTHTPLVSPLPEQSSRRPGTSLLATWDTQGGDCPAAAIEVRTYRVTGTVLRPANDVAFHILLGGND